MSYQRWSQLDYLREGYASRGPEHTETATYTTFEDGTYKVYVLTIGRVEWFARQYAEQTSGNPALSPELD